MYQNLMDSSKKINVIRVESPSSQQNQAIPVVPKNINVFPKMPQMYLELMENKDKIKQQLVNKDYDPSDAVSDISYFKPSSTPSSRVYGTSTTGQPTPIPTPLKMNTIREKETESFSESSSITNSSIASSSHRNPRSSFSSDEDNHEEDDVSIDKETRNHQHHIHDNDSYSDGNETSRGSLSGEDEEEEEEEDDDDESINNHESENDSSSIQRRLPISTSVPSDQNQKKKEQYEKLLNQTSKPPPRLSELRNRGEISQRTSFAPDLNRVSPSEEQEREEELKRELLFKFDLLKRSYTHVTIPEFTIHTDLRTMMRTYENCLRRVSLDSSVESYKSYLIGGFMVLEFIFGNYIGLDMQGFTQQQILNMNQYERVLIEMGEKSYTPGGSSWSPEIRLVGIVLVNAFIFIISKLIMKKTGNSVISMMNVMNRFTSPTTTTPSKTPTSSGRDSPSQQPHVRQEFSASSTDSSRRKMKGPSIELDDLPEL